jgi:hypothetical protein
MSLDKASTPLSLNSASPHSRAFPSIQAGPATEILQVPSSELPLNSASLDSASATHSSRGQLINSRRFWMRTHLYESHRIRYTRFCWGKGSEVWGYVHISGGDCTNPVVQPRKMAVDELITAGGTLAEVLALLRSFENAKAGRKPGPVQE